MIPRLLLASAVCAIVTAVATGQGQAPVELKVKAGDMAPDFSLPGTDGKIHKLSDYKGHTVVLAWFPKAFTGGLTAECRSLRASGEIIEKYDVAYFMVSVDKPEDNKAFAEQEQADFPMLSNPEQDVAKAYGVVPPTCGLAKRWMFFIGPDGKILHVETQGHTADAGTFLAAKLEELGVKKK